MNGVASFSATSMRDFTVVKTDHHYQQAGGSAADYRTGEDHGFGSVMEVDDGAPLLQLLQPPQPPQPPQLPQLPSLQLAEQPAQFYRFRYESEVAQSRVGGLLLGRGASDSSRSFIKLLVAGINPGLHSQLQLTACTVNSEDKAPHPYYLHGDCCRQGYFEETKTVDGSSCSDWEISFTRLAIICVPKKRQQDIDAALAARLKDVPELHDCPKESSVSYDSRNLGRVRLAFSLSYKDTAGNVWVLPTVFSDEIQGGKERKQLDLADVNPPEVKLDGSDPEIAIYTSNPTTGFVKNDFQVLFTDQTPERKVWAQCGVKEMKKHLLIVKTPSVEQSSQDERLKCSVVVSYKGFQSNGVSIIFLRSQQSPGTAGRSQKRPHT